MKSILNYMGKKYKLDISKYIEDYNLDIDTYCEPFAGGFSAGLNLIENQFNGKIIFNDLDNHVCTFWIVLKNNWEELYNNICETLDKLVNYVEIDDILHELNILKQSKNPLDTATFEYIYRKCLGYKGFIFDSRKFKDTYVDFFLQSEALNNVIIENTDYHNILDKYDSKHTLFLIDPPYYMPNIVNKYYRCDSDFFYHKELADRINRLQGKVIITYNQCDYIKRLYGNFKYKIIDNSWACNYNEIYFRNF